MNCKTPARWACVATLVFTCLVFSAVPVAAASPAPPQDGISSDAVTSDGGTAEAAVAAADKDFQENSLPLFDGESLAGWEGEAYWFRVEDGAIVAGKLDERIPHNQFLCTTQNYDHFDLRFEARLVGQGNNAGVQFRSQRVPDSSEVSGYQADIGAVPDRLVWGALYDESRRRKMLAEPNPEKIRQLVKEGQWNAMRVLCNGDRIQIFVNGEKTVDYTEQDDSIRRYGVIGLQIHGGPPAEAWYRNLRIRQLDVEPAKP